jgi:hypothetical protein
MNIETLGEAYAAGWRVLARCAAQGWTDGPTSRSNRECTYRRELDMESLVWTRERVFPLARPEMRLHCPRCGSRAVRVLFEPSTRTARCKENNIF